MPPKIMSVIGSRPQFVKAAALSRALAHRGDMIETMIHTGQHYDYGMSKVFFDELAIAEPRYNLAIHGSTHGDMTGRMLVGIENILLKDNPDVVIVYGDTNSTLAGALAASKLNIPIVHVEAGLRSFNTAMPEETNRVLTDHMSTLLFCPTQAAMANLEKEGITKGVFQTGDIMMDATLFAIEVSKTRSKIVETLNLVGKDYAVATIHRQSNTDDPLALGGVIDWLKQQANSRDVIMPLHPRTVAAAARSGISMDGLTVIAPLGPLDMTQLLAGCSVVFTDSGGLQKEAYFHAKPCVTLRAETEWVETIEAGWNRLWSNEAYQPRKPILDYGTGDAGAQMARLVAQLCLRAVTGI
jgi:UDP-GlcNAc3NAcA epimerase